MKRTAAVNRMLKIFWRDVRRLVGNPVALIITIGVCVIPSLYAWYNIRANWDPYANTAGIKIAVANEDEGTSNEYVGALNAGDEVVAELRKNDQLGWTFVDAAEAREGVRRGDYYAAVIIPADFSRDLTSMLTGSFTQPKLSYYVNEKRNAIAPKVTDAGVSTIQDQVNATFVATVSETVVSRLQEAGGEVEREGDQAESGLAAGVDRARGSLAEVRAALSGMQGTITQTKEAARAADETLGALKDQLPSLSQALSEGDALLASARQSARTFSGSLADALSQGGVALGKASGEANAAVSKVSGVVSGASSAVDAHLARTQGMIDDLNTLIARIQGSALSGSPAVQDLVADLTRTRDEMQGIHDAAATQSADIAAVSKAVAEASSSLDTAVSGGLAGLSSTRDAIEASALPQIASGLDAFSDASGDLAGAIASLAPVIEQARGTLSQLSSTLDQAADALTQTDRSLEAVDGALGRTATDLAALRSSAARADLERLLEANGGDIASFMAAPVELSTEVIYPVATYGSGVAPFYTNLALWVGGFVLIAIIKLEVDREGVPAFTATEGYFGRWLLLVVLGAVQAVIVCAGDLVIGVQCEEPALFMLAGIWISFVYVNIIYALSIAFKHIGKALGVILVIVQIPGSSGMYPIEMMPGFFRAIHPLLPFTYGINALRETIGGLYGLSYLANLAALAAFAAVALLVGVGIRPLLLNLNVLFDRELTATGVMVGEENAPARERFSVRLALRALIDADGFRAGLVGRAARFEARYPRLVRIGFCLVFGLPVALFALTAVLDLSIDGKIGMLVAWIVAVIVADVFLIVVEYLRQSLEMQMRLAALADEELRGEIRRQIADAPVANLFGVAAAAPSAEAGGPGAEPSAESVAEAGAEPGDLAPSEGHAASRGDAEKGGDRA